MKSNEFFTEEKSRAYTGDPLEKGGTSISGNAAPALRDLFAKGHIKPGMMVLDFGAGKFARNANFLREQGVKVYAYDPYNGSSMEDGWTGTTTKLPSGRFDVGFTSFVLNVVPEHTEDKLLKTISGLCREEFHITRNQDIAVTVKAALLRKDKLVSEFFLTQFADDVEKEEWEGGSISAPTLAKFCKHGVQTSKGFQRIPFLEEKGYSLVRRTGNFKVYKK